MKPTVRVEDMKNNHWLVEWSCDGRSAVVLLPKCDASREWAAILMQKAVENQLLAERAVR